VTTTYATTDPTPGPVTVSAVEMSCTSPNPIATTSPDEDFRPSAAPNRVE
jgi:hypothetical protein